MNVFCLGADQIDPLWDRYAHHLDKLSHYFDCQDIREELIRAEAQLWGLQDGPEIVGVVVTRITKTACEVVGGAGSAPHEAMRALHREIEAWAKTQGCTRMRLFGRKGWLRLLSYTQTGIVGEKEI